MKFRCTILLLAVALLYAVDCHAQTTGGVTAMAASTWKSQMVGMGHAVIWGAALAGLVIVANGILSLPTIMWTQVSHNLEGANCIRAILAKILLGGALCSLPFVADISTETALGDSAVPSYSSPSPHILPGE